MAIHRKAANQLGPEQALLLNLVVVLSIMIVAVATMFLVTLPGLHIGRIFYIPSNTMSPALDAGDRVYMNQLAYLENTPRRDDVVVFWTDGIPALAARNPAQSFVKRIVGLPGERLSIQAEGQLCVNGSPASEFSTIHYTFGKEILRYEGDDYTVPPKSYFVLGDNSWSSSDSRYWGCVPLADIRGRVEFRFWPLSRIGWIK